ncbi:MAG: hypothetical protein GWO85_00795, partial [Simkaniaceae bacterium]|nr:hypothetical protein [Simkaniaceae bacterium]
MNYIKSEGTENHISVNTFSWPENKEEDVVFTRSRKPKPPKLSNETIKRLISQIDADRDEFIALDVETAN